MRFPALLARLFPRTAAAAAPDATRRRLFGAAAALTAGGGMATAAAAPLSGLPRAQLALMLRGLASLRADPGAPLTPAEARTVSAIAEALPEAPQLLALYREWPDHGDWPTPPEMSVDPDDLFAACHESCPVQFAYTDLKGAPSCRRVLPLELVHGARGLLLIAWCELRGDYRQFYAQAMEDLEVLPGSFAADRARLLAGFLASGHRPAARRFHDC